MSSSSRRTFLAASTAALGALSLARSAHAAGDDVLKIGLIGCGGRGSGAASQALRADPNVKLVALGDAFEDRLQNSLKSLLTLEDVKAKIDVPPERQFVGFDAYQQVLESGVDVVLLATPPHFRPLHLKAAIAAGKHVFAEKPVAVDAPGIRSVLETCKLAKEKRLSVVSGLCLRYSTGFQETIKRIHDGAIGEVRAMQANDYRGPIWVKPRQADWTDMHWQMRNWYYFTWLSGDFNVEQHVHFLDVCAWVMQDKYPAAALGMGGRQVRTGPEYGNIYDHFGVTYTYDNGVPLVSNTRQMAGCKGEMSATVLGSKGIAQISERRNGLTITSGDSKWVYKSDEPDDFYQTEHNALFASIRKGEPINNGEYMSYSSLLAIQGRMSAYTGQQISWDEALESKEDLSPPHYAWGPIATPAIAVPGVTKFT
jgi:predicted dehydrogenase